MSLAGVLAGCGASQLTSKATSSSTSAKSTKTQTKRQRLISALPKGVKSTDSDLVVVNKSVLSAANSGMYASTRMLYSLSLQGYAPKTFGRVNRRGIPIMALLGTTVIGLLTFLSSLFGVTLVFKRAGLAAAASVMNAVILTSVLSAANSGMYASTRMLYS
ncbi:hypothetical protein WP50_23240, partial [Lactiplantibacillus plantarum]